jgi:tyrosyl-tRNA synthetase
MNETFFDAMRARGLVASVSHEEELVELLQASALAGSAPKPGRSLEAGDAVASKPQPMSIYAGFDPTAPSLHVGHLVPLLGLRRAQDHGLRPIVLFGGATGLVGDPTGRVEMRRMHTEEDIAGFIEKYQKLTRRYFVAGTENDPLFLNNFEWLGQMTWIRFARDVGVHFTIARLLAADVNRTRFESGGLTFLELGYQLLQAYDFLHLNDHYSCAIQLGGNDQWSNILAGADLIRRTKARKAFALTFPLLTSSDGQKIGKTAGNAVWLDPDMFPPYDFFQYFRNVRDDDLPLFFRTFTFVAEDEILELVDAAKTSVNAAKERLASVVTAMVHGDEDAKKALGAARALFLGEGAPKDAPTLFLAEDELKDGVVVTDVLVRGGLCKSKSEGRKLIEGGGLQIAGQKVTDAHLKISLAQVEPAKNGLVLRKGKKDFLVVKQEHPKA